MSSIPVATRDIRRVFVANRGEIAVRVVRACNTLGIEAVAGVSEADQDSLAARLADQYVVIGPPPAAESYLRADMIVRSGAGTALRRGAPGLRLPFRALVLRARLRRRWPGVHRSIGRIDRRDGRQDHRRWPGRKGRRAARAGFGRRWPMWHTRAPSAPTSAIRC